MAVEKGYFACLRRTRKLDRELVKGRKLWEKLSSPSVSGGKLYMGKICDEQMPLPSLTQLE